MFKYLSLSLVLLSIISITSPSEAKRFRNSYISFELPKNWVCHTKGVATVCSAQNKGTRVEAQIAFLAKEAGANDSIENFKAYLNKPQMIEGFKKNTKVQSKAQHVRTIKAGNKIWADGLHQSGEQEAYYTRYAATVHSGLVILVTFNVHRKVYSYYAQTLLTALRSLTVVFNKNIVASAKLKGSSRPGSSQPLGAPMGAISLDDDSDVRSHRNKSKSNMTTTFLGLLVILGAVAWYFLKKKKII